MIIDTTEYTAVNVPAPLPLTVPTFGSVTLPGLPDLPAPPLQVLTYPAYATAVQDYLDGRISDFSSFYTTLASFTEDLAVSRFAVKLKYHRLRDEYLQGEGKKNPTGMPGYVMRKLMEFALDEKREHSEAGLKAAEKSLNTSLENLSFATEQAIKSDGIRFDSHNKLQAANLEIAAAVVDAAQKGATATVQMYNEVVKLIDVEWENIKQQLRYQDQQVTNYLDQIKAIGVVVDNEGVLAGLAALSYELQAIAARRAALEHEIDLLNAQILKNAAELELAQAEQLIANAKGITASYEIEKASARSGLAAVERAKNAAKIAKLQADTERVRANADMDKAELALSVKEKELGILQDRFEVARKEFDAQMTEARKRLPEIDKYMSELRAQIVQQTSELQTAGIAEVSQARFSALTTRAWNHYTRMAGAKGLNAAEQRKNISTAAEREVEALIQAAENAADSRVESTFIRRINTR